MCKSFKISRTRGVSFMYFMHIILKVFEKTDKNFVFVYNTTMLNFKKATNFWKDILFLNILCEKKNNIKFILNHFDFYLECSFSTY